MKTNFLIILFLLTFKIFSQGLINNSSNLYLTSNSNLILYTNANLINNGTINCASGSNVKFTGPFVDQYIGGLNVVSFYNLYINKAQLLAPPNVDLYLQQDVIVNGTIYMSQGHLNLRNNLVDLGTTGIVSGENYDARIRATDASKTDGAGTGYIRAIRNNPSGNVAGLGLDFTSSVALGNNTVIVRGCNALQGSGTYTGNYSIFRWYRINPGSGTASPITVNNFYYWGGTGNPELNGHIEANLQMFQQVQYWNGSTNPIYWEPRTTTVTAASDFVNSTTTNNPIMLNYILVTLGSTDRPLPVEFLSFDAKCNGNTNLLTWQTASETNNQGYSIEKSHNSIDWEKIGFVNGNGNVNTVSTYSFTDNNPYYSVSYYRLEQIDYDGQTHLSNLISADCKNQPITEDFHAFMNNGQFQIVLQGLQNASYNIIITNSIGQTLYYQTTRLSENKETIDVPTTMAAGLYYISIISENTIISKPFLIK